MEIQRTKNVAGYISFPMVDKTNPETFKSGESVTDTAYYKDGAGAWTSLAITDTVSEIGSTGLYELDLTAGELNHDQIIIKLTAANSQDQAVLITTIPAPANMKEIDEQDTNGYNATLKLAQLDIQSQTAGQPAINLVGNTSGAGLKSKGGANAHGFELEGGSNFGHGLQATGTGSAGKGGRFVGSSSGGAAHGISLEATGSGNGLHAVGGTTDYTAGIHGESSATNGRGMELHGSGSAAGFYSEGGATGIGGRFRGGATSGGGLKCEAGDSGAGDGFGIYALAGGDNEGILAEGDGSGAGIHGKSNGSTGTGVGILGAGGGVSGDGISGSAQAGNSDGISAVGSGTGHGLNALSGAGATGNGILAQSQAANGRGIEALGAGSNAGIKAKGGATGAGINARGGDTSGDGLICQADTDGHGLNIAALGASKNGINIDSDAAEGINVTAAQNAVKLNPTWAGILVDGGTSGITLLPATGSAIYGVSGSSGGVAAVYFKGNTGTDDAGMLLEGDGSGDGLRAAGGVTGRDIYADEIGARFDIDGVTGAGILEVLKKFADDNGGADYDATTDSLEKQTNQIVTIDGIVDSILEDTGTTLPATLTTIEGKIDTIDGIVDDILVDTNELQTDWTDGGRLDLILDSILEDTGTTLPATLTTIQNYVDDITGDVTTSLNAYDSGNGVATQSSVDSIQNNTRFVAAIPSYYLIPSSSFNAYKITVNFYDTAGNMEDPDSNDIGLDLDLVDGTDKNAILFKEAACTNALDNSGIAGHKKLERTDVGQYFAFVKIASTESVGQLVYNFALDENSVRLSYNRMNNMFDSDPAVMDVNVVEWNSTSVTGDGDWNELQTDVDAILEDTGTTLPATLSTIEGKIDTIDGIVDAILVDTGTTIPATLTSIEGKVDTIDGVVDAILVDTNELQTDWTDGGRLDLILDSILEDTGTTIPATLTTIEGKVDTIDGIVDAILLDTNELQTDWTNGGRLDLILDDILLDTGTTIPSTLTTIEGKIDTVDTVVDAILVDTGTTIPATLATLATQASVDVIDGIVDAILVDTGTTIPATLTTIEGKIDTIDGIVDAILVDTGTTLPATLTTIEGKIDTVDGVVDAILIDTAAGGPGPWTTADVSALALEATLTAIKGSGWVAADNLAEIAEDVAGLNGAAMRGTDNALLAASAPSNWSSMAITAGGVVDGDIKAVNGQTAEAARMQQALEGTIYGKVNATPADSSTLVVKNLTNTNADMNKVDLLKNRVLIFISGVAEGQAIGITDQTASVSGPWTLTTTAMVNHTNIAADDEFVIV